MPPCPWGLPPGLKCPPVLIPSPALQSPFSCTWKPCSPLGLSPVTCALTRTLSPCCVKVTVPAVALPLVGSRAAPASWPSIIAPPVPLPIAPQPATSAAATATPRILFICLPPFSRLLRSCVLGRHLFGSLLRRLHRGRWSDGRYGERRRLRNWLSRLLHVRLVVLDRIILRHRLVCLCLVRGGRILRLPLLGGCLALLVERRRRRG